MKIDTIYCGDCAEVMRRWPDECIDLTVTSPPYDNLRIYEGYVFDFEAIAGQLYRVTKKGGVVVWVVTDQTIDGSESGTSFRQALHFMSLGFNLHDTMIWEKTGQGAVGRKDAYWQNFEYMFIFCRGAITFNPIEDRRNMKVGQRVAWGGRQPDGNSRQRRLITTREMGRRTNVWKMNPEDAIGHPAPFPQALARDHILSWSNPDDVVLDPMCGSGTTPKMAKELDRHWIGIDISQEYCDLSLRRVNGAKVPLPGFS
jgi:site-specific DNA-methyltransferase (adenine-specific)